ncbi:hypothetical protein DT075_01405 [Bacillus licheniformis]|nr:hypothetical protein DT075_01405 [Bacillus licheniformis]
MNVSEMIGGMPAVTAVFVILTALFGSVIGPMVIRYFRIDNEIARGVLLGTSAHGAAGGRLLTDMLQPATVAFAIPLYKYFPVLKKYAVEIIINVAVGCCIAILSTAFIAKLFKLNEDLIEIIDCQKKGKKKNMLIGCLSLIATVLIYLGAKAVYSRHPKVYASPLLVTPVILVGLLLFINVPFEAYSPFQNH